MGQPENNYFAWHKHILTWTERVSLTMNYKGRTTGTCFKWPDLTYVIITEKLARYDGMLSQWEDS